MSTTPSCRLFSARMMMELDKELQPAAFCVSRSRWLFRWLLIRLSEAFVILLLQCFNLFANYTTTSERHIRKRFPILTHLGEWRQIFEQYAFLVGILFFGIEDGMTSRDDVKLVRFCTCRMHSAISSGKRLYKPWGVLHHPYYSGFVVVLGTIILIGNPGVEQHRGRQTV